jgi:hypothetical protein
LQIEKVHVKNKKATQKWSSEVQVLGVGPLGPLKLHFTIENALVHSISEHELENIMLKRRISQLEDALSPKPLFVEPLAIISPNQMPPSTPGTSTKVRKVVKFLKRIRLYVTKNINKRLNIISQEWEVSSSIRKLSERIANLTKYLKKDLEHEEAFYKKVLSTFIAWVSSLSEYHRNQQHLPSDHRIKQLRTCWLASI